MNNDTNTDTNKCDAQAFTVFSYVQLCAQVMQQLWPVGRSSMHSYVQLCDGLVPEERIELLTQWAGNARGSPSRQREAAASPHVRLVEAAEESVSMTVFRLPPTLRGLHTIRIADLEHAGPHERLGSA